MICLTVCKALKMLCVTVYKPSGTGYADVYGMKYVKYNKVFNPNPVKNYRAEPFLPQGVPSADGLSCSPGAG